MHFCSMFCIGAGKADDFSDRKEWCGGVLLLIGEHG